MIDIAVNFRTTYVIEKSGEEVISTQKIALQYLRAKFWIDLLASFPFDAFSYIIGTKSKNTFLFQILGLLKLVRILRLSRLIAYMNLNNELKMSLKLIKQLFFLVLYLHCLACIWYFIVKQNQIWIPPLDYLYLETQLYEESAVYKYAMSIYHAVLMLSSGDIGPRNTFQAFFVTIMLVLAAIINAAIFGNMAVLLQSLNRKTTKFQEKMEYATETMKTIEISNELQDEVKTYLSYAHSRQDYQEDYDKFINILSPSLKQKVINNIFYISIRKNSIFKDHPSLIESILANLKTRTLSPEERFVRQGEVGESLYFIARGDCDVFVIDENKIEKYIKTLSTSEYFGEVALIKN